jgi:hypothetical protein
MPAFFPTVHESGELQDRLLLLSGLALIFWFLTALIAGEDSRERLKWLCVP